MDIAPEILSDLTHNAAHVKALQSEVHVWLAKPERVTDPAHLADCIALLCADESDRYRHFRFLKDRHLFLVSHALVRRVLSLYVDIDPSDWRFTSSEHGRPEIAMPELPVNLRFNLSHTDGLAACVVTLESDCGIDVEKLAGNRRMQGIAAKVFAEPEQRDLREQEGSTGYRERFFSYWTLREAWCKALGTGLAHTDRSTWFELDKQGCGRICRAGMQQERDRRWHIAVRRPTPAHVLAVAVHGADKVSKRIVFRFVEPCLPAG